MKNLTMLKIASVLSMLLFMIHVADDIARGIEEGAAGNLTAIPIFVVWGYGALVLGERRSGYVIMLLGGLFALLPPALHMGGSGVGLGSYIDKTGGVFAFSLTLLAIGTTGLFSVIVAAQVLYASLANNRSSSAAGSPTHPE